MLLFSSYPQASDVGEAHGLIPAAVHVECCEATKRLRCEIWDSHGDDMKMVVFWDVELFSLVDTDLRFGGAYCLHNPNDGGIHLQWNVSIYQTARCYIPEDNHLQATLCSSCGSIRTWHRVDATYTTIINTKQNYILYRNPDQPFCIRDSGEEM
jgi:hypothetical protein